MSGRDLAGGLAGYIGREVASSLALLFLLALVAGWFLAERYVDEEPAEIPPELVHQVNALEEQIDAMTADLDRVLYQPTYCTSTSPLPHEGGYTYVVVCNDPGRD